MARGRPKKFKPEVVPPKNVLRGTNISVAREVPRSFIHENDKGGENDAEEKKEKEKENVVLKKEAKLEPLAPGQQYFEAPDGTVLIGESTAQRLWYRKGNTWINPKR